MITIRATIDILNGGGVSINEADPNKNIPRSLTLQEVVGSNAKGGNPLLLGITPLGTHPTLNSSIPYFISDRVQSITSIYLLTKNNEYIDNITIKFDTYNNIYPQSIRILSESGENFYYANDDAIFTVKFPNKISGDFGIDLSDWNNTKYPARIESISVGLKIVVDKRNMLSYNGIIQKKADEKLPSWGIVSTTGNLSFNDTNKEMGDYADENILIQDLNVEVELLNTLNKKSKKIGSYKTDTWDYENNSREVSVSLKDDLTEWQDIFVEGYSYDPRKAESINGKEIYKHLYSNTPSKHNMLSFDNLPTETRNILEYTVVPYKLVNSGTLWEQWTKLCELCACHIYKSTGGTTVLIYGG